MNLKKALIFFFSILVLVVLFDLYDHYRVLTLQFSYEGKPMSHIRVKFISPSIELVTDSNGQIELGSEFNHNVFGLSLYKDQIPLFHTSIRGEKGEFKSYDFSGNTLTVTVEKNYFIFQNQTVRSQCPTRLMNVDQL